MNKKDLKIIYMGTPDFAVEPLKKLVENNYNIIAVVTNPDKPAGNSFLKRVLGKYYRENGAAYWKEQQAKTANEKMTTLWRSFADGNALDYDVVESNSRNFNLNVQRCGYAEFFKALGESELGFLLCCSADVPMTEGFGGDVELEVKQTIMQGAPQCEFRYQMNKD